MRRTSQTLLFSIGMSWEHAKRYGRHQCQMLHGVSLVIAFWLELHRQARSGRATFKERFQQQSQDPSRHHSEGTLPALRCCHLQTAEQGILLPNWNQIGSS